MCNRRRSSYEAVGFTPYRTLFLHLLLIGYPFRFGLVLFHATISKNLNSEEGTILPSPCAMFHNEYRRICEMNSDGVNDFWIRLFSQYSLSCVTLMLLRRQETSPPPIMLACVRVLLLASGSFLLMAAWLQHYFFPTPLKHAFDEEWFHSLIVCYGLAVLLSVWSLFSSSNRDVPQNNDTSMKWSIPANAIFCDAVSHIFGSNMVLVDF